MSKKFEIIRPKSLDDEAYAEFEYLIRWIGRDGADYIYMFYDAELNVKIRNTVINSIDEDRIEALVDSEKRSIDLTANDLSKNDLLVIGELFANKYVTRIKKDGTIERYAPDSNSYKYQLLDYRYEVSFKLIMPDEVIWK